MARRQRIEIELVHSEDLDEVMTAGELVSAINFAEEVEVVNYTDLGEVEEKPYVSGGPKPSRKGG